MPLVLQHCCKTSWIAMLRVLPTTFKPVLQQIKLLTSLNVGSKHDSSNCSNLQNKLHIFVDRLPKLKLTGCQNFPLEGIVDRRNSLSDHVPYLNSSR